MEVKKNDKIFGLVKEWQIIQLKENPSLTKFIHDYLHGKVGLHGIQHCRRVELFGIMLARKAMTDFDIVRWFAYLHDSMRNNDGIDIDHGERASMLIDTIRDSYLSNLSEEQVIKLKSACKLHNKVIKTGDIDIDICFDADRLDLPRVLGMEIDPSKMATKEGHMVAKITKERYTVFIEALKKAYPSFADTLNNAQRCIKGFTNGMKHIDGIGSEEMPDLTYEIGKTYKVEKAKTKEIGFHAIPDLCCPLDVFFYIPAINKKGFGVYTEVELSGDMDIENKVGVKNGITNTWEICATEMKILREIGIRGVIDAFTEWTNKLNTSLVRHDLFCEKDCAQIDCKDYNVITLTKGKNSLITSKGSWSSAICLGDFSMSITDQLCSHSATTGIRSTSITNVQQGVAVCTGDASLAIGQSKHTLSYCGGKFSASIAMGFESAAYADNSTSIAANFGANGYVRGVKGSALFAVERNEKTGKIIAAKGVIVDGKNIKEDTWYKFVNGCFVEA